VRTNPSSEPARPRPFVPLLDYQREDVESDARFRWNCWARQTGKSFTKSLRRILRGLSRRRNQIFLSAGERQSRELMEKARQHCQALKIAADYYDDRSFADLSAKQLEIILPGGVRIIGLPANPQTARGFTGDVFLDEFAMHTADRDIWAAMFPTLLRGDGELDIASTPKGRSNMFYELRDNPRFTTNLITLPDAIAQGLEVKADEIRSAMGDEELYRQEFLCEFLDEAAAFLTYEQIAGCTDPELITLNNVTPLATETRELFVGVDVGRLRDLTVIWVLALEDGLSPSTLPNYQIAKLPNHQITYFTVALIDLANAPFRAQFDVLSELLGLRTVRRCCIDAGGIGMQLAEQLVERFGSHRVKPMTFTLALKSQLAGALRIAVESRAICIPADERIRNDWHSVERTVSESGHFRLSAPRREGSHADRFWAAALALHAADSASGKIEHLTIKPIQFARTGTW
jgi:phage FluMu gp28-like protein